MAAAADAAAFITVSDKSRANLHRRYSLLDDIRGIGWSRNSNRERASVSPGRDHHSTPLAVEFQETSLDTTTQAKTEMERLQKILETSPLPVIDLPSECEEPIAATSDPGADEALAKAIVVELENGTELFPSSSMLSSEVDPIRKDVRTFSQLPDGIRAWEVVDFDESQPGLLTRVPKEEDPDKTNNALKTLDTTPDIGNKILQMLTGVRDDIKDMKTSINETTKRYVDLENRLALMELKLEAQGAMPLDRADSESEEEVVHGQETRKGWRVMEPDPQEPFCSTSGAFLWIGGDRKHNKQQQSSRPTSPTLITGRGGTMNEKFAILLENQLEITKQLGFFISQLRSVREAQEEQNLMLRSVSQGNIDLNGLVSGVTEDIAGVKSSIKGSMKQYNKLEGHLDGLEGFVSNQETKPSLASQLPSTIDLPDPAGVDVESPERKIFKPDPKAPFCALNGNFIWIGTDIE